MSLSYFNASTARIISRASTFLLLIISYDVFTSPLSLSRLYDELFCVGALPAPLHGSGALLLVCAIVSLLYLFAIRPIAGGFVRFIIRSAKSRSEIYMSPVRSTLAILLFWYCTTVKAVCPHCAGTVHGCRFDDNPSFCPYVQGVANNVAIAAAGTGVIILGHMLPHSWLDLFPRGTLDSIIAYMARSKQGGAAYDFTGKTVVDINQAVKIGTASAPEAIAELTSRLQDVAHDDVHAAVKIAKLKAAIDALNASTRLSIGPTVSNGGPLLFTLFRCSKQAVVAATAVFDGVSEAVSSSSNAHVTSDLSRPRSEPKMMLLLNTFGGVGVACGLFNPIAWFRFVEMVVISPIVKGVIWPIAFESLLIYLRFIDEDSTRYCLSNVVQDVSGMDVVRAEATESAEKHYPSFFRASGGNPGRVADTRTTPRDTGNDDVYTGNVTGCTDLSRNCCFAFNGKLNHKRKDVDNGVCKYVHLCSQWVSDKGPGGQCRGEHRRVDCNNPNRVAKKLGA